MPRNPWHSKLMTRYSWHPSLQLLKVRPAELLTLEALALAVPLRIFKPGLVDSSLVAM